MNPLQLARRDSRIDGHVVTRHARARMVEFGLGNRDVRAILTDYELRYEQTDRGRAAFVYQLGPWGCVVDATSGNIVTVVRRVVERWEH